MKKNTCAIAGSRQKRVTGLILLALACDRSSSRFLASRASVFGEFVVSRIDGVSPDRLWESACWPVNSAVPRRSYGDVYAIVRLAMVYLSYIGLRGDLQGLLLVASRCWFTQPSSILLIWLWLRTWSPSIQKSTAVNQKHRRHKNRKNSCSGFENVRE